MIKSYLSKINLIQKELIKLNLDAFFISSQANISYLTGFTGLSPAEREGFFFITKNNSHLLLFSTYYGLYKNKNTLFNVLNITPINRLSDQLLNIYQKEKIKTIGFEKDNLTFSELESLQKRIKIKFVPTQNIIEKQRIVKDKKELSLMKKAALITDQAFKFIIKRIKRGVTEKEVALDLEFFIKKHADDIAFSPIVAFGKHAAIPHYIPNNNKLTNNNLILFDFGAKVDNYCSDMTRVVFFGKPGNRFIRIYQTVIKAQEIALNKLGTLITKGNKNIRGSQIDQEVKNYLVSKGFPPYPHGLGHGVGIEIHEAPKLRIDSKDILTPGMVFTIEPGIYIEGFGGVRIEDLVLFNKDGLEILSQSPKSLKSVVIV